MADRLRLDFALQHVDAVLHLAGVNRAEADVLRSENLSVARSITSSLDRLESHPAVVYANSIHSGDGTPFGDGKEAAADHLIDWGRARGAPVTDVRLPNLFGEHGRPHYNSVVATFSYELSRQRLPVVEQDREVPLLHVQDAVDQMLDLAERAGSGVVSPRGRPVSVSELLLRLKGFSELYATGDLPDIWDDFGLALFNTYRSFCFPDHFPISPTLRSDARGNLFEAVRSHGGRSHVFCSTTGPGHTRGQHFHRRKVERFLVLRGTAEIALRRLFDDTVVRFKVSGDDPAIVDMPTMWAHAITNIGNDDLLTMFWANDILDPQHPDTYPELVVPAGAAS